MGRRGRAGCAYLTLNQTVLNEPNLRTVVLALGTNDILAGTTPTAIEQTLTSLMSPTTAYGLGRSSRNDGSAIRSILTTVPPLGLDPNDQREKNRQALNADILVNYKNYGADGLVDLDSAVRDSANANQVDPSLLTGGSPNTTYYDRLAQVLADAVVNFPPSAQL